MYKIILFFVAYLLPVTAFSKDIELITSSSIADGQSYTAPMSAILLMTLLAMIPTVIIVMTPFLRITIVLGTLRQAMGLNTVPTNKVIASMSLVVTFFIMSPVIEKINATAIAPYADGQIEVAEALTIGVKPLRKFMLAQTKKTHLEKFLHMSGAEFTTKDEIPMPVVVISFVASEIQTALKIGFMIYLPFILIDLLVATVLMSLGLMMMSPMIIAVPIKIMLFVLVDGWALVVENLSKSFFLG